MKILQFIYFLLKGHGWEASKHVVYHWNIEVWTFSAIREINDDFFESEHFVRCPKCGHTRTSKRGWPNAKGWHEDFGLTYKQALEKAKSCNQFT
jgi:uncharacterized C2H2 Zn-finger protein